MGNIADLFIFSRHPDNEDIDCMYRQQQATLGMCRRPEGMWGRTFWNEMTTGEPGRQLFLSGDAQLVPGVGLDLTKNNKIRAMGDNKPGGYMLMDGNSEERGSLTLQACGQFCKDGGYQYAGLQSGISCYCDNSYDMYGEYEPSVQELFSGSDGCDSPCVELPERCFNWDGETDCPGVTLPSSKEVCEAVNGCTYQAAQAVGWDCGAQACNGDDTQAACGGPWRNAVYDAAAIADNVEVPAGAYKGCYADDAANSFAILRNVGNYGENYGEDARFSVSFWFTHNYCTNEETMGNWETLFSTKIVWCSTDNDSCAPQEVWVGLTCHANSTITDSNSTVLRTIMRDDDNNMAQFDVAVGGDDTLDRSGGLITKSWVHFALVVDSAQVGAYIDGEPVTRYG